MIFNDKFLFLHVPKTGGMALSDALLKSLTGKVYYAVPKGHAQQKYGEEIITGKRHATLPQAEEFLNTFNGNGIEQFECILTMIRNPYDLEISRFHYLRKGHPWDKGKAQDLAIAGDFDKFVSESKWWFELSDYFLLNEKIPDNLKIIRFEQFATQISQRFESFFKEPLDIGQENKSNREKTWHEYINKNNEALIYQKYQWLFDKGFYDRFLV